MKFPFRAYSLVGDLVSAADARGGSPIDTGMGHLGFRRAISVAEVDPPPPAPPAVK